MVTRIYNNTKKIRLEYSFDDALLKEIPKKFNEFEKMFLALVGEGVSYSNIAEDLRISRTTVSYKSKKMMCKISHQIKNHYQNNLPVTTNRIEALLSECVDKKYICPPENLGELRQAFKEYNPNSYKTAKKDDKDNIDVPMSRGRVRVLLKDFQRRGLIPSQEETKKINDALFKYNPGLN